MKIGILAPWANGDVCISTSVLRHTNTLWPGAKIVWYVIQKNADLLSFNPFIHETRIWSFLWENEGFDNIWRSIADDQGILNDKKLLYKDLADIDKGYFSVPWANKELLHLPYVDIPKRVFGVKDNLPWHPCLFFSPEEETASKAFVGSLPRGYNVMLETQCFSGQSSWDDNATNSVMARCRAKYGNCNFIFASKNAPPSGDRVFNASHFTVRQCIPLYNMMDLFIGISSGITCATCAWSASPNVRRIVYGHREFHPGMTVGRETYVDNVGRLVATI